MKRWTAIGAALCMTACADLLDIVADGRCGNAIVEPANGEDCDTFAAEDGTECGAPLTEGACQYVCGGSEDVPCPSDWVCGVDRICRVTSGRFDDPIALSTEGRSLAIGDVDGDRWPDLVSFGASAIEVWFGDPDGRLILDHRFAITQAAGSALTGDLDGDDRLDIAVPQDGGMLLALGERDGSLLPVAVTATVVGPRMAGVRFVPVRVRDPDYVEQDRLAVFGGANGIEVTFFEDHTTTDATPIGAALQGLGGQLTDHVAVADLDARPDQPLGPEEVALTMTGAARIPILAPSCVGHPVQNCRIVVRSTVALPGTERVRGDGTFFGDVDGDGHLDLVVVTDQGIVIARGDGHGRLVPAVREASLDEAYACGTCRPPDPRLLAVGDLDADGVADYVTATGIYVTTATAPLRVERKTRAGGEATWNLAEIADFNRDGLADVATVRTMGRRLEILLATKRGLFNSLSGGLDSSIAHLDSGDFDGDLVPDLAVVDSDGVVSVLFGNQQGLPRERFIAAEIEDVQAAQVLLAAGGPPDRINLVDDLLVVSGADRRRITLLNGSTARRLDAPLPTSFPPSSAVYWRSDATDPVTLQLLMSLASIMGRSQIWLAEAAGDLQETTPRMRQLQPDPSCIGVANRGPLLAPIDFGGDFGTGLLAMDRRAAHERDGSMAYVLERIQVDGDRILCQAFGASQGMRRPRRIRTADLDGDGSTDAVVAQADPEAPPDDPGDPGLAVWWGEPGGRFAQGPLQYSKAGGVLDEDLPIDVALVNVDADPAAELVLVTDDAVFVAQFEGRQRLVPVGDPVATIDEIGEDVLTVEAADVNGDGLDDIIVGTATEVLVYQQSPCSASDAEHDRCARGSSQ